MIVRHQTIVCYIKNLFIFSVASLILGNDPKCARATTLGESVEQIKRVAEFPTTGLPKIASGQKPKSRSDIDELLQVQAHHTNEIIYLSQGEIEKKAFAGELLKLLHEQYGSPDRMQSRQGQVGFGPQMMHSLLEAIGAEGDMRRLIEWIRNTFNVASIPDLTTQFVVSKLGSVNCPALLKPDKEETLIPRFLLFNEHFVDVPFELSINPNANECIAQGKFDPRRKTIILVHGYLTGYTLVDGMTNIKNRLIDLNKLATEKATETFSKNANYYQNSSSFVYTEDLNFKIRSQLYNVILVDWFNGANPTPRANYIKAAVNAQVVGKLIARFLSALVVQCGTQASNLQIIAHSLGCHVSGFTGKAMNAAGHKLGKITHLDPVGLCFGRLFSQPRFRLNPNDALETQAVHVSLNIFDNPLDGAQSNFLVNGGRDQTGCGGQSEVKNSTTSSVSLLFDPAAKFSPCSHLRALALYEDDHSSEPGQCQLVGYRCKNFDKFLAGKCGQCDAQNSQCRLMSLPPFSMQFRKMTLAKPAHLANFYSDLPMDDLYLSGSSVRNQTVKLQQEQGQLHTTVNINGTLVTSTANQTTPSATIATSTTVTTPKHATSPRGLVQYQTSSTSPIPKMPTSTTQMFGAPSYLFDNRLARRSDRTLVSDKRERLAEALEKLRTETQTVLVSGWKNLRGGLPPHALNDQVEAPEAPQVPTTTTSTTTPAPSPAANELPDEHDEDVRGVDDLQPASRGHGATVDKAPLGSQKTPSGSLNMPQYYLGTGAVSPYCVNYYQFRVLIAERRLDRVLKTNGLGSNRLLPQLSQHRGGMITAAAAAMQQRAVSADGRDMLHLTVKLTDSRGRFFKGFSMLEYARTLDRVPNDFGTMPMPSMLPLSSSVFNSGPAIGLNEPMFELTMLLNSTRPEPQRIEETIISYYFHQVVLADRVEINFMSNISPEVRAKYSSVLCPVAINDRHQLVRYIDCQRVAAAAAAAARK